MLVNEEQKLTENHHEKVATTFAQEIHGNSVISIDNGQIIGSVGDIMIDPETLDAAALATSKGNLLNREIEAIPAADVQVWGQDAVLVKHPDVIVKEDQLPDLEKWLSVSDDIKGRDVIDTKGTRIGKIKDVLINAEGHLAGYRLSQVYVGGPLTQSLWIPAEATRSLGEDVLIAELG